MTNISKPFITFFIETMEMYLSISKKINFTQMARFGRSCESRFRDDVRLRYIYRGPKAISAEGLSYMTAMSISIRQT